MGWGYLIDIDIAGTKGKGGLKLKLLERAFRISDPFKNRLQPLCRQCVEALHDLRQDFPVTERGVAGKYLLMLGKAARERQDPGLTHNSLSSRGSDCKAVRISSFV